MPRRLEMNNTNKIVIVSSWEDGYRIAVIELPFTAFEMFDQNTPEWKETYSCFRNKPRIKNLNDALLEANKIAKKEQLNVKILWGKRSLQKN